MGRSDLFSGRTAANEGLIFDWVGWDENMFHRLDERLEGFVQGRHRAVETLDESPVLGATHLVLGPLLTTTTCRRALERLASDDTLTIAIVEAAVFEQLASDATQFYLSRAPVSEQDLFDLIVAASRIDTVHPKSTELVIQASLASDRISLQKDLELAVELVEHTATRLIDVAEVRCQLVEDDTRCTGLIAFAARAAKVVAVPRIDRDPRYAEQYDTVGHAGDRFCAVPLRGYTGVIAVLCVTRAASRTPFSLGEIHDLESWATYVTPHLERLVVEARLVGATGRGEMEDVFREEALASYRDMPGQLGRPMASARLLLRRIDRAIFLLVLASVVFFAGWQPRHGVDAPAVVERGETMRVTATFTPDPMLDELRAGDRLRFTPADRRSPPIHLPITELTRLGGGTGQLRVTAQSAEADHPGLAAGTTGSATVTIRRRAALHRLLDSLEP